MIKFITVHTINYNNSKQYKSIIAVPLHCIVGLRAVSDDDLIMSDFGCYIDIWGGCPYAVIETVEEVKQLMKEQEVNK